MPYKDPEKRIAWRKRRDAEIRAVRAAQNERDSRDVLCLMRLKDNGYIEITGPDGESFMPGNATDIEWLFDKLKAQKKEHE